MTFILKTIKSKGNTEPALLNPYISKYDRGAVTDGNILFGCTL